LLRPPPCRGTGWISAQIGSKSMILAGGLGLVLLLPALLLIFDPLLLAAALLVFGASLGTIDRPSGIDVRRIC
jgi:hypothetical protein